MFEPALSPQTLTQPDLRPPVGIARSGGDLADRRSLAPTDEWGHAHIAPTNTDPERRLGMPPFTV